jgi:hypothetical protein
MTTRVGTAGFKLALLAVLGIWARDAAADGERTPMLGLAVVGGGSARTPDHINELVGLALDLAWWHGPLGIAVEGSSRWSLDADAHALVLGGSVRLRVVDGMAPALLDTRQVEVALELQAIVERAWWNTSVATDPLSEGGGLAIRVRGATEPEGTLGLAESRYFLRVMTSQMSEVDAVARMTMPAPATPRALTVLIGIGASFGGGTKSYMDRFRSHPYDPPLLVE